MARPSSIDAITRTVGPDEAQGPLADPRQRVGRYALIERIGRGGFGEVWRAEDTRLGDAVAIKLIPTLHREQIRQVMRELCALRWLRLPGVVRLRDDGVDQGRYYLVMDLVEGRPFPGAADGGRWEELRPPLVALLEILARVHRAGVIHRDLKPANILVTPAGRPVVLDFGISRGRALARERTRRVEATLGYAAPEQLAGWPMDARGDLYALGAILFEALSGSTPHSDGSWMDIRGRRLNEPAPPLASLRPDLPEEACRLVDALLQRKPQDRPADAESCLALLGRGGDAYAAPVIARLQPERPASAAELVALFQGPDLFLHVAEDAARLLLARTGGDPARVAEEVAGWCRLGLAHWAEDGLALERPALDRLLRSGGEAGDERPEERRLREAVTAELPAEQVLALAERASRALLEAGLLERARAALELALDLARGLDQDASVEIGLLRALCNTALSQETPAALSGALLEIERSEQVDRPELVELARLVQAARAAWRGDAEVAASLLADLPPLPDEELEIWRQAVRLLVAMRAGPQAEDALLAELEPWAAGSRLRLAKLDGWRGNRRYRQLAFEEAARLHERSAAGKDRPDARLSSLVNAAQSWLEADRLDRATALAEQTASLARALRRPRLELMSAWVLRQCAYRQRRAGPPRLELVAGAEPVDAHLCAGVAMTEAAVAWRRGEDALAAALARRSARGWRALDLRDLEGLVLALAAAAGDEEIHRDALAEAAREARYPRLGLQTLGLLRLTAAPDPRWRAWAEALAAPLAAQDPTSRRELLSIAEALGAAPVDRDEAL